MEPWELLTVALHCKIACVPRVMFVGETGKSVILTFGLLAKYELLSIQRDNVTVKSLTVNSYFDERSIIARVVLHGAHKIGTILVIRSRARA